MNYIYVAHGFGKNRLFIFEYLWYPNTFGFGIPLSEYLWFRIPLGGIPPRAHSTTVIVAYGGHPEECAGTKVAVLMTCINLASLIVSSEPPILLYLAHHLL